MRFSVRSLTRTSAFRGENQDAVFVEEGDGYLVAGVFDGMGGRDEGREAARIAVATVARRVAGPPDRQVLFQALKEADAEMRAESTRRGLDKPMGATCTVVVIDSRAEPARLLLGHIGDSRAYLGRGARLLQLSVDAISPDMAALTDRARRESPRRHILTAALGVVRGDVAPWIQFREAELLAGDLVLLVTDGISDHLGQGSVASIARKHATMPRLLVRDLCRQAERHQHQTGSGDNLSAVALSASAEGEAEGQTRASPRPFFQGPLLAAGLLLAAVAIGLLVWRPSPRRQVAWASSTPALVDTSSPLCSAQTPPFPPDPTESR